MNYSKYFDLLNEKPDKYGLVDLGQLKVPTGKIIICDPLSSWKEKIPLDYKIAPGDYPVQALFSKKTTLGARIALAWVQITPEKAISWEPALENKNPANVTVDSGFCGFCDEQTHREYVEYGQSFYQQYPRGNIYLDYFEEKFTRNSANHRNSSVAKSWLNFTIPTTSLNVVMFESGFGDGIYNAFWGKDQNKEICCLLLDFEVIENANTQ